ncbi:gag-pol polyprotein [Tanacetum coccineum]
MTTSQQILNCVLSVQLTDGGFYVAQPDGFIDPDHPDKVYRLRKALYGLKQAPRAWYDELSKFLISKGFTKDADHAGCIDTRKSTSGGISVLGETLVSLDVKRSKTIYGFNYNKIKTNPFVLRQLETAIAISCKPPAALPSTNISIRGNHFIKEQVENGIIELYFVRTEYQLADMFTKALPEERFQYLVRRIGMRCLTPAELEVLTKESA